MGIIGYIISLVIVGFVIGGLGRLVVPGPNPIGAGKTLGLGLVGALVGSLIGGLLGLGVIVTLAENVAHGLGHGLQGVAVARDRTRRLL